MFTAEPDCFGCNNLVVSLTLLLSFCNTTEENTTQSQSAMPCSVRQSHTASNVHYLFLVATQILISVVERTSESSRRIPFRYYANQYAQYARGDTPQHWGECNYSLHGQFIVIHGKAKIYFCAVEISTCSSDCVGAITLSCFRSSNN